MTIPYVFICTSFWCRLVKWQKHTQVDVSRHELPSGAELVSHVLITFRVQRDGGRQRESRSPWSEPILMIMNNDVSTLIMFVQDIPLSPISRASGSCNVCKCQVEARDHLETRWSDSREEQSKREEMERREQDNRPKREESSFNASLPVQIDLQINFN